MEIIQKHFHEGLSTARVRPSNSPSSRSSWTLPLVADRREHQCRTRDRTSRIFFPSSPSLPRFVVERGFLPFGWWVSIKKNEKEPSSFSSSSSFSFSAPQKRDTRRSTSTDRSQATGTEFSSVRNASLRLCPGFTTLYSGLRFMRYHRSRPGPFHK